MVVSFSLILDHMFLFFKKPAQLGKQNLGYLATAQTSL